jgi:uncharacterized protein YndB with AHSA1/START domain
MNPADAKRTRDTSVDESLVYEFDLPAPLEKVWHALTDPQLVTQWMLPEPHEPHANVELELAACEPPSYVAYHWRAGNEPQTLVSFELHTALDGGTRLRLTHQRALHSAGPVALLQAA